MTDEPEFRVGEVAVVRWTFMFNIVGESFGRVVIAPKSNRPNASVTLEYLEQPHRGKTFRVPLGMLRQLSLLEKLAAESA